MINLFEGPPSSGRSRESLLSLATGTSDRRADFVLIQDLNFGAIKRKLLSAGKVEDLGSITTIEREGDIRKAELIIAIGAPSRIAGQSGKSGLSMNDVMGGVTRIRNAFKDAGIIWDTFYDAYFYFTLSDINVDTFNKESDATAKVRVSIIADSGWISGNTMRAAFGAKTVRLEDGSLRADVETAPSNSTVLASIGDKPSAKDGSDFVYTCRMDLQRSLDIYPIVIIKEKIDRGGQAWLYLYTKYKGEIMGLLYSDANTDGEHVYKFNFEDGTIIDELYENNRLVSSRDVREHLSENGGWFHIPGGGIQELNIAVPSNGFCENITVMYRERYIL